MGVQDIQMIALSDLVLWSENPRDKITITADNQKITDQALEDTRSKWALKKLANQMGDDFDFSESPTVVFHGRTPVVYDGNRRVILGLLSNGLVKNNSHQQIKYPYYPNEIPCNVCDKSTAFKHVLRKHADSGSWSPLERDTFLHKFMGHEKSIFMLLDELTGLISNNPLLNQGFVRDEVLSQSNLEKLGFKRKDDQLLSRSSMNDSIEILNNLADRVKDKTITTRLKRGNPLEVLDLETQKKIDNDKGKPFKSLDDLSPNIFKASTTQKRTRRTQGEKYDLFGESLYLQLGEVNNLYRDIHQIYVEYKKNPTKYSSGLISLIRMSLRLLTELASNSTGLKGIDKYINKHFVAAKAKLDQPAKTFLSNQNVTETSIIQLLQSAAHSYQSNSNEDQTIAISMILGRMLTITHGK